jgi:hypothetical protein
MGFERREEAERFLAELRERFAVSLTAQTPRQGTRSVARKRFG